MKTIKRWLVGIIIFALLVGIATLYLIFFPYIHKREVIGPVSGVKSSLESTTLITSSKDPSDKIFSAAVAVKDIKTGEIVTGSTEDRQWGVIKEGQCVKALFFPYPPWNLQKAGTYNNARVISVYEKCEDVK